MFLSPQEKAIGSENFCAAVGSKLVRRNLLRKAIAGDVKSGGGLGPLYFDYDTSLAEPLRVGVIGAGDEGSVLVGAVNPNFITVKAIADIRPYNVWRAFHGDYYGDAAHKARPGLMKVYGWKTEAEAKNNVKVYGAYQELIDRAKEDKLEAVIIALPLHLHAPAAIAAMKAGLHVLTEKLMAHSVHECKEMARVAAKTKRLLATGHQRHYNILYQDAAELIRQGLLGELHSIRAQWHRNNLPGDDSWQQPMPEKAKPDDPLAKRLAEALAKSRENLAKLKKKKPDAAVLSAIAFMEMQIEQRLAQMSDDEAGVDAAKFGYKKPTIRDAAGNVIYQGPAIEELIRWRLWDRTGAGLMAELGSHQLDAAGIFVHAIHQAHNPKAEKPHPLCVVASGSRPLFPADRDCEDHVYCLFEFPAPDYNEKTPLGRQRKIGVQYASINGNGFGGYGETVFGTEGTLIVESEKDAMLYKTQDTGGKTVVVEQDLKKNKFPLALKVEAQGDPESVALGTLGTLPADRGYTEELEHWAWCIRHSDDPKNLPHCHPKVALADAVIALVTNRAVSDPNGGRFDFQPEWFDIDKDATPEGVKPDVMRYA
jgi:predicted dehydrogenase